MRQPFDEIDVQRRAVEALSGVRLRSRKHPGAIGFEKAVRMRTQESRSWSEERWLTAAELARDLWIPAATSTDGVVQQALAAIKNTSRWGQLERIEQFLVSTVLGRALSDVVDSDEEVVRLLRAPWDLSGLEHGWVALFRESAGGSVNANTVGVVEMVETLAASE